MAAIVAVGFKLPYSVGGFVDAQGNVTTLDPNTPVISMAVSDPTMADIVDQDAAKPLSGAVRALKPGTCQLQVVVDVDRGDGQKPLTILGDVEVTAGDAVTGVVSFDAAVPA